MTEFDASREFDVNLLIPYNNIHTIHKLHKNKPTKWEVENEKIRPDEGGAGATHEARGLARDDQASHQCALLKINNNNNNIIIIMMMIRPVISAHSCK